jgi:signal transduction histidine kinase
MSAGRLAVLLVEDSPSDAELIELELRRNGWELELEQVQTGEEMRAALERGRDVIICDYSLPGFGALDALRIAEESGTDAPFIILSGTIGEEAVVEALKAGARDCVLKDNLGRLGPVVVRELDEADTRRKRREAERELQQTVELLRATDAQRRRLLAGLVEAQEEERQRIASDIHDDSVQVMSALVMRLGVLRNAMDDPRLLEMVEEIERIARASITRLRRLMFELRPPALDREGLAAALRLYLEHNLSSPEISHRVTSELQAEPTPETRTILYRIAQEALNNVRKHASATRVDVLLAHQDGGVVVRIGDDGVGFDPGGIDRARPGHLGVSSMRERAEIAGGWWRIDSAPGRGTVVEFWVPDRGVPTKGEEGSRFRRAS